MENKPSIIVRDSNNLNNTLIYLQFSNEFQKSHNCNGVEPIWIGWAWACWSIGYVVLKFWIECEEK